MHEVNRQQRGHDFLPPAEEMAAIPSIDQRPDVPADQAVIHLHYFSIFGDWWISAVDPEDADGNVLAYGYVILGGLEDCAEWGNVLLNQVEQVRHSMGFIVERDLDFQPGPFGEVIQQ